MAKKYKLTQDGPEVQALLNKIEGIKANQTPAQGESLTPLENLSLEGVLYSFITKAVNDLLNYYTKSETYTKAEVEQMFSTLANGAFVPVAELPTASAETFGLKIYLVPAPDPKVRNLKDEYITVRSGEEGAYTYAWEQIGSTAIDLSGYVTTEALNTALGNYVTSADFQTALANYSTTAQMNEAIAAAGKVVFVTYGTTTYQEIVNAYNAGKVVIALYGDREYILTDTNTLDSAWFIAGVGTQVRRLRCMNTNQWVNDYVNVEITNNKSQSIETDKTSTNKYPSAKAVADAITAAKEIFWAEYNTTTAAEIIEAKSKGMLVLCLDQSYVFQLTNVSTNYVVFASAIGGDQIYIVQVARSNDNWIRAGQYNLERTVNKVATIVGNESDTVKYPTTKAVYDKLKTRPIMDSEEPTTLPSLDLETAANKVQSLAGNEADETKYLSTKGVAAALGKLGVISQTQTWSGRNYTMSDLVYGTIPQANIDLYEAAGVVFNSTTGYFELNGLTDISYSEMRTIYAECCSSMFAQSGSKLQNAMNGRTNLIIRYTPYESFGNIYDGLTTMCRLCPNMETMMLPGRKGTEQSHNQASTQLTSAPTAPYFGYNSSRIKKVIGVFDARNVSTFGEYTIIRRDTNLEYLLIDNIKASVYIVSGYFLLECIVFLVDGAANTSAITVTLHADAYARCVADTTEYTYNEQTYTGILAYASARNITIASA